MYGFYLENYDHIVSRELGLIKAEVANNPRKADKRAQCVLAIDIPNVILVYGEKYSCTNYTCRLRHCQPSKLTHFQSVFVQRMERVLSAA